MKTVGQLKFSKADNERAYVILERVCEIKNIQLSQLIEIKTRKPLYKEARQLIYFSLRKYTTISFEDMAAIFGQNHATAMHAQKVIRDLASVYPNVREDIKKVDDKVSELIEVNVCKIKVLEGRVGI